MRTCTIMAILYALVARGATVLAEYADTHGNVSNVAHRILDHIPHAESRMSYIYDRYACTCRLDDRRALARLCRRSPFACGGA